MKNRFSVMRGVKNANVLLTDRTVHLCVYVTLLSNLYFNPFDEILRG